MNEVKPISSYFGGFPHSPEKIAASPDPQRNWYMLHENLMSSIAQRPKDVLTMTIIAQDWAGRRKIQKLMRRGWTIQSATPRRMLRGDVYVFVRPQVSAEEAAFLGWKR